MFGGNDPFKYLDEDTEEIEDLKDQVKQLKDQLNLVLETKALENNPILVCRIPDDADRETLESMHKAFSKAYKDVHGDRPLHLIFVPESMGELHSLSDAQLRSVGLRRIPNLSDRDQYEEMLRI